MPDFGRRGRHRGRGLAIDPGMLGGCAPVTPPWQGRSSTKDASGKKGRTCLNGPREKSYYVTSRMEVSFRIGCPRRSPGAAASMPPPPSRTPMNKDYC